MKANKIWKAVLAELELSTSPSNFVTWIKAVQIEKVEQTKNEKVLVTLRCPSPYHQQRIEQRYLGQIQKSIERVTKKPAEIEFTIGKVREVRGRERAPLFDAWGAPAEQKPGKNNLNPRLTFETYVVGASNNFAYAAGQGVAKNPGTRHNPLFIYGGVGLGKTHLMHAIGHAICQNHPDWNVMYLSAETFGNDLIASLQNKRIGAFKKKYRTPDVLLIDDVQFIAGKEYTQEEFFHTFNELYMSQRQIVLTSDRPPQEIPKMEERLSSRFMGGVMVDIQPPDFETRVAILTQKCRALGAELANETIAMIAEHSASNIRVLEGALQGILTKAAGRGGEVTNELVREFFGAEQERRSRRIRPTKVISTTAKYYEYKTGELTGKSRRAPLVQARHIAMYLLYAELGIPYEQVGRLMGGRDHTTAMHAVDKITQKIKTEAETARIIADIKHKL